MVLHFRRATGIFVQTLPFVLLRLAVGAAFGLFALLYFGIVLFVVSTVGGISGVIAVVSLIVAVVVFGWVVRLLRRYVLYLVTAGHVAVIAHAVDTGEVPKNQLSYGEQKVTGRFVEASALFAVDQVIKGAIKQFNRAVMSFANLVDFVPALKNVIVLLKRSVGIVASYLDEAILAHMFLEPEKGNWTAARDGIVLYAKTWKSVLGSAVLLVLGGYALALVALLALTPLAAVFGRLSPTFELLGWAVVAAVAVVVYFGIIGPYVKTVIITTYLIEARDETPDSEMMDYISERSSRFRELMQNAKEENRHPEPESDHANTTGGEHPETDESLPN